MASSPRWPSRVDLQPVAPDLRLELVRRPLGDHEAAVDHRDPVGEPVGLVEVLRRQRTVVPPATSASIASQRPMRLRMSSPVVGSSRKRTGGRDEARRGRAAAHASGVGADQALPGVGQVEVRQQLLGAAPGVRRRRW